MIGVVKDRNVFSARQCQRDGWLEKNVSTLCPLHLQQMIWLLPCTFSDNFRDTLRDNSSTTPRSQCHMVCPRTTTTKSPTFIPPENLVCSLPTMSRQSCRKDGFCGLQEMTADKLNFLKDFWDCGRHTGAIFCYQSWFYGFIVTILTLLFNFLQLSRDLNTQTISETILSQWTL